MILDTLRAIGSRLAALGHVQPTPELVDEERRLYGPRPGDLVAYGWHGGRPGHVGVLSYVPGIVEPDPPSVVEARRWVGQGRYRLGAGGRRPEDGTPLDAAGECDCSGFACHVIGIDRRQLDGWINTSAIVADARTPGGRFDAVPLYGVDLRRCRAIHCHGGRGPAISETSAALWHGRGVVARFVGQVK